MNRKEQNTWNAVANKPLVRSMDEVVAVFQHYVETYDRSHGLANFTDECFISDMLYGIGKALDEKYEYAPGYRKFKVVLREHLQEELKREPTS